MGHKVFIKCPHCESSKFISLQDDILAQFEPGVEIRYPIKANEVCDHSFLVVLDGNYHVRHYE